MTHNEYSDALVDFILENRRKYTFGRLTFFNEYIPFSRKEVENLLLKAFKDRTCIWLSIEGEIIGVAVGEVNHNTKTFICRDILCTYSDALPKLLEMFNFLFPQYTLKARRNGCEITYNTKRLLKFFIKEHAY